MVYLARNVKLMQV